jgi:predicted  nucleic acid-binding Zn-ribbon protein
MAEPENLVLELLRELRDEFRSMRVILDNHTLKLDFLEERIERLREATMTGLGFAVDANERNRKIEIEIADLRERVEKLEKAK